MTNEIDILNGLKEVISRELNNYLDDGIEHIDERAVKIDSPDVDTMEFPTFVFIAQKYWSLDNLTGRTDFAEVR